MNAIAVAFCLAFCLVLNAVNSSPVNSNVGVAVVKNLTRYLIDNPDVKLLHSLEKAQYSDAATPKSQIIYQLGNRVGGDRLVATASGNQTWPTSQDVKLTVAYPKSGVGAVVTLIQVIVDQTANLGRGYVTAGGIGQRSIVFIIEAQETLYFKYVADIFGY